MSAKVSAVSVTSCFARSPLSHSVQRLLRARSRLSQECITLSELESLFAARRARRLGCCCSRSCLILASKRLDRESSRSPGFLLILPWATISLLWCWVNRGRRF